MRLNKNRRKIDKIDKRIVELLNERAQESQEIGKIKKKMQKDAYAPHREKEIYDNVTSINKGPLSGDTIRAIYREIMSGSLALEKLDKIAYLGPHTFTHDAAEMKFGSSVNYIACDTIPKVFNEVEKGKADYGVVPIENSIVGGVMHTLDMFVKSPLRISSEIYLDIVHNLLANTKLEDVKVLYSHPVAYQQCRAWVQQNIPKARYVEASNTGEAAKLCSENKNSACIASVRAARKYGLNILTGSIEDVPDNKTRFLVIGKNIAEPTGKDKTSIMFSVKDKVGVLHDALVSFKKNKINLTKIESRPSRMKAWDYFFFVDLEGHSSNKKVKNALKALEKECSQLKVLGSYPVGR